MQLEQVASTILPVFGIVLLGYITARIGVFRELAVDGVAQYVFAIAIPLLLFRTTAGRSLPAEVPWDFLYTYYGGALAVFVLGMLVSGAVFKGALAEQGVFGGASAYSNTVLLGLPIVFQVLGEAAALPLFILIGVHSLVLVPLIVAAISIGRREGGTIGRVLRETIGEMLQNPIIIALLAGALYGRFATTLPAPVDYVVKTLGDTAGPCALFALGGVLARYRLAGQIKEAATISVLKLAVHPLVVWILGTQVFHVRSDWLLVAVLLAGMPTGINVFIFAHRFTVATGTIGIAVVMSTALAVFSLTGLIHLIR